MARKPAKKTQQKAKKTARKKVVKKVVKKTTKNVKKPKAKPKPKPKPKPKKRNGRPPGANSVFTATVRAGIISSLKAGLNLQEAAINAGVSESGLRAARRADPKFSSACEASGIHAKLHSLKIVYKSKDPAHHLRFLEYQRRCKDGAELVKVEHTGKDGGAIKTQALVTRLDIAGLPQDELKAAREAILDNLLKSKKLKEEEAAK